MTGLKETDSPFLKERGEGIGPFWSNTYPPTPFQLEGEASLSFVNKTRVIYHPANNCALKGL
jgi:hypothetical protein